MDQAKGMGGSGDEALAECHAVYEQAERGFLDAVRKDAGRPTLGAAAVEVRAAAQAWESEAYRQFFETRDRRGSSDRQVIELEIDADRAEVLAELWSDLAEAYASGAA